MDKSFIFMVMTFLLAGFAFVIIPKHLYKKFFLYGVVFGGLGDTIVVFLLSKVFHLIEYKATGNFNILGLFAIWTPISWTFAYMVFLYLMPVRKVFLVLYLLIFTMIAYSVGLVLQSFGLFEYIGIEKYLASPIFLIWCTVSAWIYSKNEHIALR